ncbi:hypothetical protein BU26DRAFT_563886 [Trematosphaeria pertusa]|uniref:Uncharacterized protein n=1 Tax=Trematosphaeria pertusa TaxID=390896 RepID=A0A6A6IIX0_9PLEO|nr:uncharacterized protein BU26DRAFT_563886 [Trematosphaeria pertusa]KAF2249998.1 hypothetical protein BU26DRAFT_563886 [Trematosphaeria pertusa]
MHFAAALLALSGALGLALAEPALVAAPASTLRTEYKRTATVDHEVKVRGAGEDKADIAKPLRLVGIELDISTVVANGNTQLHTITLSRIEERAPAWSGPPCISAVRPGEAKEDSWPPACPPDGPTRPSATTPTITTITTAAPTTHIEEAAPAYTSLCIDGKQANDDSWPPACPPGHRHPPTRAERQAEATPATEAEERGVDVEERGQAEVPCWAKTGGRKCPGWRA